MTKELLSAGSLESTVCLRYAHPWALGVEGLGGGFSGLAEFEMGSGDGQ